MSAFSNLASGSSFRRGAAGVPGARSDDGDYIALLRERTNVQEADAVIEMEEVRSRDRCARD